MDHTVDKSLERARARWKWLRLIRHLSILGVIDGVLLIALGAAIVEGIISRQNQALVVLTILGTGTLVAAIVVLVNVAVGNPGRRWLAAAMERIDWRFQDRLNTLLFLETRPDPDRPQLFISRIAEQARGLLREGLPSSPFCARASLVCLAGFLSVLGLTAALNQHYFPWGRLQSAQAPSAHSRSGLVAASLSLPRTNRVEQSAPWGEVRISDPGADVRVTKVDVVPLKIEAAANQDIKEVIWYSSVNGNAEQAHPLPAPGDPRNAVYQPMVYLDELELSDWDVMTYYAKAQTGHSESYASELYFVEVRPFREDILKMPGGEGGQPYQTLNQISSLVGSQQHVIRETHQHVQNPPAVETSRRAARDKLAQTEVDLGKATHHLYGEMAANMENQPIGQALDNLAKAEDSLRQSGSLLEAGVMPEAQDRERAALAQLVATRKIFQQAVSDHPGDFTSPQDGPPPVTDSSKKLKEMAEFRDEAKSAQEFIKKLADQQKELEERAGGSAATSSSQLGDQEQTLERDLQNFLTEHPRAFKGAQSESDRAQHSLEHAGQMLHANNSEAPSATHQATQDLQLLRSTIQNKSSGQTVADSYRLKQMLGQQIRALEQIAGAQSPGSTEEADRVARTSQDIIDQLKKNLEQGEPNDTSGAPLRDELSNAKTAELAQALRNLQDAGSERDRRDSALDAKTRLEALSQAFAASEPKSLQAARRKDTLKPDAESGFAQGMSQLDSLLKQLQQHRKMPPSDANKQARQALSNLQTAMASQSPQAPRNEALLNQLEAISSGRQALNPESLKQLIEQLERFSIEARTKVAANTGSSALLNLDPDRLPSGYRSRIERYFQKLSEK